LCVLSVRDTGIGIPKESIPSIFDRFYVVDRSRSRETGGSGLGLSIVKRVAEIHGARIEVESEVGAGTLFRILFQA
jgi:two-component system phosphate regulon sensor histidine kinase PhoR